jgi:hypothetical protein
MEWQIRFREQDHVRERKDWNVLGNGKWRALFGRLRLVLITLVIGLHAVTIADG